MTNFPADPIAYIPRGGVLSDGGGELRKRRTIVSLSGQHIRRNEDLALAICDENFTPMERHEFLLLIHHHITQVLRLQVQRLPSPTTQLPQMSRPPIKPVYSRRQRVAHSGQQSGSNQGMVRTEGSSSRDFKGKGLMAEKPTLQQFINAAVDEQVAVDRLISEELGNAGQLVPAQAANTGVEDEAN
ncbi:hypothetical protein GUJ93_ZPchr0008g11633 [Zizania palustris]|uniref:DUF7597 domain-containing protein n=1 Tax=Zizania palustris TaxID=103762 RepID=A0A8J5VEZ9_ZIZPA|nr:hypothetical protein GUJ93_ZPchr0008g11633 [Zizania palustris]